MKKIISIQILRGIAASLVVFLHVMADIGLKTNTSSFINFYNLKAFGDIGVDIFFVISGFIMVLVHYDDFNKESTSIGFLKKRILRIAPLYWFFTLFATVLLLFLPEVFSKGKTFDLMHLLSSLSFIPWYNSIGEISPVIGVGWTLNVEMYFYLIFAFCLLFPRKYLLIIMSIVLVGGLIITNSFNSDFPYLLMIARPLLLEFLAGVYIGWFYKKGINLKYPFLGLFLGVILFVINIFMEFDLLYRVLYNGIPSVLIIYSLITLEKKYNFNNLRFKRGLLIFGAASYSIYLSHPFTYKFGYRLFSDQFISLHPDGVIIIVTIFSLLCGIIVYYLIEKPLFIYTKKIFETEQTEVRSESAKKVKYIKLLQKTNITYNRLKYKIAKQNGNE